MKWLRLLEDVLWPRGCKCLCCDELSDGKLLCSTCQRALEAMRLSSPVVSDTMFSTFRYDGAAKQLVLLLKEKCLADAAEALAQGMAETLRQMELPAGTVLTWVTMPERRRRDRGIDHGRMLCQALGRASGMPVTQLLTRIGKLHTQRGLSRGDRLKNLTGTFVCREKIDVPVLLIDDVMTTGATASACAQKLMEAGAPRVFVLTATRVSLKTKNKETQKG